MNEDEKEKMRDHVVTRIVELASTAHAEDLKKAGGVLAEYFSRDPKDDAFLSKGEQGTFDTGFGMMVFAGTMAALFRGTAAVLAEVSEIPRGARRRIEKVENTIKERHIKKLRDFTHGSDND